MKYVQLLFVYLVLVEMLQIQIHITPVISLALLNCDVLAHVYPCVFVSLIRIDYYTYCSFNTVILYHNGQYLYFVALFCETETVALDDVCSLCLHVKVLL